jgi:hypothetical protein
MCSIVEVDSYEFFNYLFMIFDTFICDTVRGLGMNCIDHIAHVGHFECSRAVT